MDIVVYTSDPGSVDRLLSRGRSAGFVLPEERWLHPRTRLRELVSLVEKGGERLSVLTWDELTVLVCLAAAAERVAEVEVRYFLDGQDEPLVLKADERGSLSGWPDEDGFFSERSEVIFSENALFENAVPLGRRD